MKFLVDITFVPGEREAIAALMPAEQAHVARLIAQGVMDTIHVAADRSRIWAIVNGESEQAVRRTMGALPLFPYMQLQYTPLLDLNAARAAQAAETAQGRGAQ